MEIGNEISHKIRTAIKAKLLDLGAYVDDELPDYIMVMVANKKTKAQMTEDLNLFLGTHTDNFTSWLHNLLSKLQSITAEITTDENHGEPTKEEKELLAANEESKRAKAAEAARKSTDKPETTSASVAALENVLEPEIHIRPEHDEFEEEVQAEVEKMAAQKKKEVKTASRSRQHSNSEKKEERKLSSEVSSTVVKEKPTSRVSPKRRKYSRDSEKSVGHVSPKRKRTHSARETESKSAEERPSIASRLGKKRRSLTSSVGAVIKHDVYDSDDEYDPLNPAVGNVASIVKVTERKSSIPPELQPNKSLLLKAMNDAQKSIESATQKLASKAVVRPMVREKEPMPQQERHEERKSEPQVVEKRSVSIKSRLGGRTKRPMSERLRDGERCVELVSKSKREDSRHLEHKSSSTLRADEEEVKIKRHREDKTRRAEEHRHSPSKEKKKEMKEKDIPYVPDSRQVEIPDSRQVEIPDSRQVEIVIKRKTSKQPSITDSSSSKSRDKDDEVEDLLDTLIEGCAEEFDFAEGTEAENIRLVEARSRSSSKSGDSELSKGKIVHDVLTSMHSKQGQSDRPTSPKFVVTLDGVDPSQLEKEAQTVKPAPPKNVGLVKPQRMTIDPVTINLNEDEDDENEENPSPSNASEVSEVTKVQQKCRFFPACKAGDQCPYIHPTTACTKFPNCHFGDKCMYLHPACKFDAQCTRPSCPFTHTVKRNPVPTAMPFVIQPIKVPVYVPRPPAPQTFTASMSSKLKDLNCKFYPNCTNMDCTFRHPKPCRFGIGCLNKETCYFYHPNLPNKAQLRWTAPPQTSKQKSSENTASTTEAKTSGSGDKP